MPVTGQSAGGNVLFHVGVSFNLVNAVMPRVYATLMAQALISYIEQLIGTVNKKA